MNKAYKVIWSSVKGGYIVVSELAHGGRNKSKRAKAISALAAILFAGSLGMGYSVQAADIVQGENNTIEESEKVIVVGDDVVVDNSDNSIVVGNNNNVYGYFNRDGYNTVMGNNIQLSEGASGTIKADQVVAIGSNIDMQGGGTGAILIGDSIKMNAAGSNSVTMGYNTEGASDSVIIGAEAKAYTNDGTTYTGGVAIGKQAVSGNNAVGIGLHADALGTESVAMGFHSEVDGHQSAAIGGRTKIGEGSYGGTAIGYNVHIGENSDYAIAIGGHTDENGAAEIGNNTEFAMVIGSWAVVGDNAKYSSAIGYVAEIAENVEYSTALGPFANVGEGAKQSNAIGYGTVIGAGVEWGNTFGSSAEVHSNKGTALGTGSSVEAGSDNSVAIGSFSKVSVADIIDADKLTEWQTAHTEFAAFDINKADSYGVFSIGKAGNERRIINVARGRVAADSTDAINGSQLFGAVEYLNNRIDNIQTGGGTGGHNTVHPDDGNVVVKPENPQTDSDIDYGLSLNKDKIDLGNVVIEGNNGNITAEEYKVGDKTYVSESGLNANDKKITSVADGEISADSKDAVNGSQLHATNQKIDNITQNIDNINGRVDKLDGKINKVGAGAAALAALHPLDFDPDEKLSFAAGVGHYEGETAAALGAFYRPDEKVMFSLGGTVGNGDEMVNAGISFALDRTSNVNDSKVAMAKELVDLRQQVAQLTAAVNKMAAVNNMANIQVAMFPDVPENHWAYDYIDGLQKRGIIEGYPNGNFGGDRSMTRYEYAAMLYRALEKGIVLDERIAREFAPELNRIRVDRISGEDNEINKVERVRVVQDAQRDNYGSKIK